MVVSFESLGRGVCVMTDNDFPLNSDTLLLAEFATPTEGDSAVDLCSGSGGIPLAWFAKGTPVKLAYGVEIRPQAVELMAESAKRSGLSDKLIPVLADLRALPRSLSPGDFDLVTCNPPYTEVGKGRPGKSDSALARQELCCTFGDVCGTAASLLRNRGRFCFCHRPGRLPDLFTALRGYGLEPKRIQFVQHRPGKEPWLVLVEAVKGGRPALRVEPVLVLQQKDDENSN